MKYGMKSYKKSVVFLLAGCLFYTLLADVAQDDFLQLFSLYTVVFVITWKLFQLKKLDFKFLIACGIIFRIIFIFSIPGLSPDFYRFLWDGNLLLQGINPYLQTPAELNLTEEKLFRGATEIFAGISELSAGNHTSYPPLNQLFFALAAWLGGKSIFWEVFFLRVPIIAAELGILYLGRKLLQKLNLPENRIFWYFLNPLVIVELTGNLHFEGVMLFFLLAAIYLLYQRRWLLSALFWSCAISVKLFPLIFLPLLFRTLGIKKAIKFSVIVGGTSLLFFLPFFSSKFLQNYLSSVGLWFQKFEFNASIYYLIRWIGFQVQGYNIIGTVGPSLGFLVFFFVLFLSIFHKNRRIKELLTSMLFATTCYLFLATTVHPWYLATPLLISVFTSYRFVLVWSLLVIFSYSAYIHPPFQENRWLLILEYAMVFGVLGYEILQRQKSRPAPVQDSEITTTGRQNYF